MHGSGEPAGPCGQDRARWAVVSCGLQQLPLGPTPRLPSLVPRSASLQGLPFCRCLVAVPVVRRLPRPPPHLIAKPALGEPGSAAATRVHLCLCPLEHGQTHSALRPAPRPVKGRSPEQSWTRFGDEASGELAAGKTALPVGEKIKRSPTPALSPPCVLPPRAPE